MEAVTACKSSESGCLGTEMDEIVISDLYSEGIVNLHLVFVDMDLQESVHASPYHVEWVSFIHIPWSPVF